MSGDSTLQMPTTATRSVVVGDGLPELDGLGHVRRVASTDAAIVGALRAELTAAAANAGGRRRSGSAAAPAPSWRDEAVS